MSAPAQYYYLGLLSGLEFSYGYFPFLLLCASKFHFDRPILILYHSASLFAFGVLLTRLGEKRIKLTPARLYQARRPPRHGEILVLQPQVH